MNVPDYGAFFKQLDPVEQDTVKDVNDLQGTNYSFFNKIQDTVQQNTINPKFGQVSAGEGGGGVSKEAEKPKNSSDGMYSKKELEDWAKKVEKGETTLQQFGDFIKAPYEADPKNYIIDEEGTKVFKESVFNQAKNIYGTTIGMINSQYQQAGKTTFNTTIPFTYVKDEDLYKYEEENKQIRAANELNGGDFQKKIEGFMTQKDEWDAHKEKMSKFYGAQTGIGSTQDAVKTADGERSLLRSWVPIQGQQGPQQALKPLKKTYGELTSEGLRGEKKDPGPTYNDTLVVKGQNDASINVGALDRSKVYAQLSPRDSTLALESMYTATNPNSDNYYTGNKQFRNGALQLANSFGANVSENSTPTQVINGIIDKGTIAAGRSIQSKVGKDPYNIAKYVMFGNQMNSKGTVDVQFNKGTRGENDITIKINPSNLNVEGLTEKEKRAILVNKGVMKKTSSRDGKDVYTPVKGAKTNVTLRDYLNYYPNAVPIPHKTVQDQFDTEWSKSMSSFNERDRGTVQASILQNFSNDALRALPKK